MRSHTAFLLVAALATIPACDADAPTSIAPNENVDALVNAGTFSSWSAALDLESTLPGAHADFNTGALEGCPFVAPDDRTMYLASNRPGGQGGLDIWVSTRASANEPWSAPANVGEPVNSAADDFCPTMSRDGETFYFVSRRQVGTRDVDWCGGADIYVARRRQSGGFDAPRNLGCAVNSSADEFSPFPLPERPSAPALYFSSTRPGLGAGGDLYRSEWRGGAFGAAELVPGVNSAVDDGQPNVRRDGLELFFYSARADAAAQGGNDLYVSTRASIDAPWSTPVNLGPAVNSAASETRPSLSWDGTTLYFGSTRAGSGDVYMTTRREATGR